MKIKLSTVLSVLVCTVLIAAAVCVGAYRGWSADREKALAALSSEGSKHALSAEDFNQQLKGSLSGRLAMLLGVEPLYPIESFPVSDGSKDAANIPGKDTPVDPDTPEEAAPHHHREDGQGMSLLKVFATIVLLMVVFGNHRGKKGSIPFGKILAVFTLFKLWKRR